VEGEPVTAGFVLAKPETLYGVRNSAQMINVALAFGRDPTDGHLAFELPGDAIYGASEQFYWSSVSAYNSKDPSSIPADNSIYHLYLYCIVRKYKKMPGMSHL